MIRVLIIGLLALVLPAVVLASEARLWIVAPAPAGNLSDCPERAASAALSRSAEARLLGEDAVVRWEGGRFSLQGTTEHKENPRELADHCFALEADGKIIVSGATLVPISARLLRFPVLQVLNWRHGEALEFELTPAFPAEKASIAPQSWRNTLSDLR